MLRCGSSGWETPLRCGLAEGGSSSGVGQVGGNTEYNP